MDWTASVSSLGSTSGWISIDKMRGTVTQPFTDVSFVNVTVDPSRFPAAGIYYGQVQVASTTADNLSQSVSIVVNVLAPDVSPGPELRPSALVFTGPAGSILPEQDVVVAEPKADSFISGVISDSPSGAPFRYNPPTADVQPGSPATIHVYPDFSGLSPGSVNQSTITLQFKGGVARTVSVLTVAVPGGASGTNPEESSRAASLGCSASKLLIQPSPLSVTANSVIAGLPSSLQTTVVDDCGNPFTGGSVSASFSNGNPTVQLHSHRKWNLDRVYGRQ